MRTESLRLDEILRRDVAITWNDGVSIIQAICRELQDVTNVGARFPLAAEVAVSPDGRVSLLRRPTGSPGVPAAGHLLGEMLQADVPVKLRLIHSEAVATTPAFNSLKDLSDALAYFERPDAQQLIEQLYARAARAAAAALDLVELEDFIPEGATSAPAASVQTMDPHQSLAKPEPLVKVGPLESRSGGEAKAKARETAPFQPERRPQTGLIAVAVIVAFVIVASGAFLTYGREQPSGSYDVEVADSPSAAPAGGATDTKALKPTAGRAAAAKSRTDAKPTPQTASNRPSTRPGAVDVNSGIASRASTDAIAATLTSEPTVPDPSWAEPQTIIIYAEKEPIDRQLPVPAATDASGEFVYSRANREVVPPLSIRPHLPSEPPADYVSDHLMVLDLVVTSKGDVESVRLLTVPKTVNDFMIVSAAKAWLFAPAKLNGRPVKYKHRIRFVVP